MFVSMWPEDPFAVGAGSGVCDTSEQVFPDRPGSARYLVMNETTTARYRMWGFRLATLVLIVSFAFIPVRCDASTAPHSIFVDPIALDGPDAHEHHGETSAPAPTAHHQHHHGMEMADDAALSEVVQAEAPDVAQELCPLFLASGSDPESQQPVGAALDLPTTPVSPDATTLLPLDGERLDRPTAAVIVLSGIPTVPESPPPKAV